MPEDMTMKEPNAQIICLDSKHHVTLSWDIHCVFFPWVEDIQGPSFRWLSGEGIESMVASRRGVVLGKEVEIVAVLEDGQK
jgi:hypothetical protein